MASFLLGAGTPLNYHLDNISLGEVKPFYQLLILGIWVSVLLISFLMAALTPYMQRLTGVENKRKLSRFCFWGHFCAYHYLETKFLRSYQGMKNKYKIWWTWRLKNIFRYLSLRGFPFPTVATPQLDAMTEMAYSGLYLVFSDIAWNANSWSRDAKHLSSGPNYVTLGKSPAFPVFHFPT